MSFPDNRSTNNGDSGSYQDSGGDSNLIITELSHFRLEARGVNHNDIIHEHGNVNTNLYDPYVAAANFDGFLVGNVDLTHDDVDVNGTNVTVHIEGIFTIDVRVGIKGSTSNATRGIQLLINGEVIARSISNNGSAGNVDESNVRWTGYMDVGSVIELRTASTSGLTRLCYLFIGLHGLPTNEILEPIALPR